MQVYAVKTSGFSMDHFDLDIEHRGQTKTFHGTLRQYGYSYRFTINVDGSEVVFEPDEERNLRAIVPPAIQDNANIRELVALIGQELHNIFQ